MCVFDRSAGASLRRYNEAALEAEIQQLVASWSTHVLDATAIFIRSPRQNQSLFTGGRKSPLSKDDPRIRRIPFATRRPTFKEVKRVHSCLTTIYVGSVVSPVPKATGRKVANILRERSLSRSVDRRQTSEDEDEGVVRESVSGRGRGGVRGGGNDGDLGSVDGGGDSGMDEEVKVEPKKRKTKPKKNKEANKKIHLESE